MEPKSRPHKLQTHTRKVGEEYTAESVYFQKGVDIRRSNISESLEAFLNNASYLISCLTGPFSMTNHLGLPTEVPHLSPKHTGLVVH